MGETSSDAKGRGFERRVAGLFELLGYSVDHDVLIGGRQIDLLLEDRRSILTNSYIVECKDQADPVNTQQYDAFSGRLRVAKREISPKIRGIIVSSVGFVREAKAQSRNDDITLLTISELETSVIDFRQYVVDLIKKLEDDATLQYFVEPFLRREHLTVPQAANPLINEWLGDPLLNHMTLLGDYGTGKTTLLKHVALIMARRYQETALAGGARGRAPIYIDLREYTQAISLKQIILDLMDSRSIKAASYAAFEYALKDGQVLLILDGFDEMASRGNYQVTLRNFRELNKSATERAKIILSCRTHYFTTDRDVQRFHGNQGASPFLPKEYTDLYRDIATRRNFVIFYLMEFEADQVEEYLRNRCGDRWEAVQAFIHSTYNLTELSRRPVLLDMIVASEGKFGSQDTPVTPGFLYQVYVQIWLERNDFSTILDRDTKALLLEQFAHRAALQPDAQLHFAGIPDLIKAWQPTVTDLDVQEMDRELRTATFLVRDPEGHYKFSHRSFQEYFYARYLLSEVAKRDDSSWRTGFFRTEVYRFIRDLLPQTPCSVDVMIEWLNEAGRSEYTRANAAKCLGGIRDGRVPNALINALRSAESSPVRRSAATSLRFHPGLMTVEALIDSVVTDANPQVRSNCLASLGRLNDPVGVEFLTGVLTGTDPRVRLTDLVRWSLYVAARYFEDQAAVDTCLSEAPVHGDFSTLQACLELCEHRWSDEAKNYCTRLLSVTASPKLAATAFRLLPNPVRQPFIPKLLELIEEYPKNKQTPSVIRALKGANDPSIESFLVSAMDEASDRNALAALDVLCMDYPTAVIKHAQIWMLGGRSYEVRIAIARMLVGLAKKQALPSLRLLLSPRERVVTKMTILRLIYDHYRDSLPDVVTGIWQQERSAGYQRFALELLYQTDRNRALDLMLQHGLGNAKTGTRVAVCSLLGAEGFDGATNALLSVVRDDYSKWVRLQALRSLCSPGRTLNKSQVADALKRETDADVLALGKQLLGQ